MSYVFLVEKFGSKGLGIFDMNKAGNIQSWEYDKVFDCDSFIQGIIQDSIILRMQHLNIETRR